MLQHLANDFSKRVARIKWISWFLRKELAVKQHLDLQRQNLEFTRLPAKSKYAYENQICMDRSFWQYCQTRI